MSSSPSTTDFRADLAKIDKRSGRMPHYRADGQKGKSGNFLERDLVPPPAGSSVSTGSRKKPRIDDDSRSPQTGSRPSFPSNPSASRNSSQRLGGFTSTRQRLERYQGLQGSAVSTRESPHGDEYSYTTSTAHRPGNWGEVRSSKGPPSDDYITEPTGSPPGSDRGSEDTGTDADPPKADQQEMNRLFTALAVTELDDVEYPTELEF